MRPLLGLVPARGGSKGIPGKNLRDLGGRPLLAWTADAAKRAGVFDRIVLTTEDARLADLGRSLGLDVPFTRPAALARDETPMLDVILHAVAELDRLGFSPEAIVLLQPTAPFRRPERIREALQLLEQTGADSVVSVVRIPEHFAPDFAYRIEQGRLAPFLDRPVPPRRQDVRPAFSRDGGVYAFRRASLLAKRSIYGDDCRALEVAPEEVVNLDDEADWREAERRAANLPHPPGR